VRWFFPLFFLIFYPLMITLSHISKSFPGVQALSDVSLEVAQGEVHALCGENGAGKSTLMNILVGHHQPDAGGQILLHGQTIQILDFNRARSLGIGIVYQERSLIDSLSVAENIFANCAPKNRWGLIDFSQLFDQTQQLLSQLALVHISPQTLVSALSPAEKQLVEIGKALAQNPQLLILDEPTASLSDHEIQTLFGLIRSLQQRGVAVIYISHRLAEIFEISDRITVLKDGRHQGTWRTSDTQPNDLIRSMVGREVTALPVFQNTAEDLCLEVEHLSGLRFKDLSFSIKKGEIVALAGLIGAGRSEVARAIFGIDPKTAGSIRLHGQPLAISHPAEAIARGIGYVPEDRKQQGLFLDMSVQENIVAGVFAGEKSCSESEQAHIAEHFKTELRIQTPTLAQPVRLLSGGNQQKCVLARWLHLRPQLLIVDEPTHGVDVGAKFEIYQLFQQLAQAETSILLISSELSEILALADRILVMHEGRLCGHLSRSEASEERILALASGRY
jgi:ribose transport system ATP-binding protein